MKLLITGGAGFIGVNAAAHFARSGNTVVVFDNLSRKGSDKNLAWLLAETKSVFVKGDTRNTADLAALFRTHGPFDAVLHCAAQVAVTTSVLNPREDFEINALGTFNLLEAIRAHNSSAALIYSSTNKVYGGMDSVGVVERNGRYEYADLPGGASEEQPLDFHSPYGCSKGAADQYIHDYARIYGLRTVVMRQSCIYGYRQFGVEDQGWVAWFCIALSQGKPLTIYGDGKQVRDVLFVDDLVRLYDLAFSNIGAVSGSVFNVGGGPKNTMSLLELVAILEELTGRKIPVAFDDWRPGDQKVFVADIARAKKLLGWEPQIGTRKGVELLYRWVGENAALFGSDRVN